MSIGTDWNLTTHLSGDIMSAIIGNIGEDFEGTKPASLYSGSAETRRSRGTESLASWYESEYSLGKPHVFAAESIEVSELRLERPRAISWDRIREVGVNG
jgi:hypothetical protein